MTKKHYKLLAQAIRRARQTLESDGLITAFEILNDLEDDLCIILQDDNSAFSYEKFTDASGRID